jgi:hypothetical protein
LGIMMSALFVQLDHVMGFVVQHCHHPMTM